MIIDGYLMFSQAQAITTTAVSTNVLDLTNARDLYGLDPYPMRLMVRVITAFTAGGAATLTVTFQGSVDNSSYTDYASSPAIAVAALTAGSTHWLTGLPGRPSGAALPRYYRLNYTVATGPMTAGTLTSALVLNDQNSHQYAAGLTISN